MARPSKIGFEVDGSRIEYDYREFVDRVAKHLDVDKVIIFGVMVLVAAEMEGERIDKALREIHHGRT